MKNIIPKILILILILAGLSAVYLDHQSSQENQSSTDGPLPKVVQINTKNQPTLGNRKALIHIVAFEDYKCIDCRNYNLTLYPQIKKQLIDTGKAQYTFVSLSFLWGSMPAANAALCLAHQDTQYLFEFAHYIYHHQGPERENWATDQYLGQVGAQIPGVNSQKLNLCLGEKTYVPKIEKNYRLAAKTMGAVHAPKLYINGILVKPLTMARVQTIIQRLQED